MGFLDKDRYQKEIAIKYCIANGVLPFLEVVIDNVREVTDEKAVITDIDVLGVEISRRGEIRRLLFDCKTLAKVSPINRAFWAAGVMRFVNCEEAYVILSKKSLEAHRLSAREIGVHLFQEADFKKYSEMSTPNYLKFKCYSSDIINWDYLYSAFYKYEEIKPLSDFVNFKVPVSDDYSKSVRELIGLIRQFKGEFDPDKKEYMALYFSIMLSFFIFFSGICSYISDIYDEGYSFEDFQKVLRYYIWGGRESYLNRSKFKRALNGREDLELPGWDDFVELIRTLIESPVSVKETLIPCRELSIRCVSRVDEDSDNYLSSLLNSSSRITQFMLSLSGYICKSTGIPKDFHTKLTLILNSIKYVESDK